MEPDIKQKKSQQRLFKHFVRKPMAPRCCVMERMDKELAEKEGHFSAAEIQVLHFVLDGRCLTALLI